MSFFNWNQRHSVWDDAPPWARKLRDQQSIIILQNEAILAKLEDRDSHLSPEDQTTLNNIFDEAKGITDKVDAAEKT